MTVKELREEFTKYPNNMKVTIAADWLYMELVDPEISSKDNECVNLFDEDTLRLL